VGIEWQRISYEYLERFAMEQSRVKKAEKPYFMLYYGLMSRSDIVHKTQLLGAGV
jgi:hypothetical protein